MPTWLSGLLRRTASPAGLAALLVVQAAILAVILPNWIALARITGGIGILDFDFAYSHQDVLRTFALYGEAGLRRYRIIQAADLVAPVVYVVLTASLIYRLLPEPDRSLGWHGRLPLLPLPSGFLDYLENGFLFALSQSYPAVDRSLVQISSLVNVCKIVSIGLTAAGFLYLGYRLIRPAGPSAPSGRGPGPVRPIPADPGPGVRPDSGDTAARRRNA